MENKKTIIVHLFNQHWFHIGALAELICINRDSIQEVQVYFHYKGLLEKPLHLHQHRIFNFLSTPPEKALILWLENQGIKITFEYSKAKYIMYKFPKFSSLQELKNYSFSDMKIGMATASHIISKTKQSNPDISSYSRLINRSLTTAKQIIEVLMSYKLERGSSEIWICNGRPLHERCVVEYANNFKINLRFFEVIFDEVNLTMKPVLHKFSPHSRLGFQKEIIDYGKNNFDFKTAESWFLERESKNIFTINQNDKYLKKSNKKLITFFTSSDDELSAVSEEWNSPWGDQFKCATLLLKYFQDHPDYEFVIRVHPNMKNKSKIDQNHWDSLSNEFSNVISYHSNVNSYHLMKDSAAVLVHGSTIGLEALYRNKPTGMLSNSRYDQLFESTIITNVNELNIWIENLDSVVNFTKDSKIIMWGNYMKNAGTNWNKVTFKKGIAEKQIPYIGKFRLKPNKLILGISRLLNYANVNKIKKI
jgi:hypothetical protein